MSSMNSFKGKQGFTIVEIAVVIVVIAILAVVGVIGYGAWRESIAVKAVKADLQTVESSMSSSNNFSEDGFPSSVPSSFKSGDEVEVRYVRGDSKSYCVEAQSTSVTKVLWHIEGTVTNSAIAEGPCPFVDGWKEVAAVDDSTCAISLGNKIFCWGGGNSTPTVLGAGDIPSTATITGITGGTSHYCAIADGWAYCWGLNTNGRLGDGTTNDSLTPVAVVRGAIPSTQTIIDVASGGNHSCAMTAENYVYCWGYGASGALGRNNTTSSPIPVAVVQGAVPNGVAAKDISAGGSNSCVLGTNNRAYCWGSGTSGENGDGSNSQRNAPVAVAQGEMPVGTSIREVSVGGNHSCAMSEANQSYCWGSGVNGRLGVNSISNSNIPLATYQPSIAFSRVWAGTGSTCAITTAGVGYCWGNNSAGQLGINNTNTWYVPIVMQNGAKPAGVSFKEIKTGNTHACGVTSDTSIYCWGRNTLGTLGDGSTTASLVPVKTNNVPAS